MDQFQSNENPRPWWEDVAHLRDGDAPATAQITFDEAPAGAESVARRGPGHDPAGRTRSRRAEHTRLERAARSDWFAQEARADGRRTKPRHDPTRPARPRATLVDVAPDHALLRRAPQVRRAPGERPTVTITGRPEAALPPAVRGPERIPARRTRERASSLVASPDRLILWAVALGILMILASIGTSADAASFLR